MVRSREISARVPIPRAEENDYSNEMAAARRQFVREMTGADLSHVAHYSVDPEALPGNIENFIGVAQVPIGMAGPLHIEGEMLHGDWVAAHERLGRNRPFSK